MPRTADPTAGAAIPTDAGDLPLDHARESGASWGLIQDVPGAGAYNMAVDEWLMTAAVERDGWLLRTYGWERPTVSLGRNQRAAGLYSRDAIAARGMDVTRRPTGGRAILHHREITYAVAAPLTHAGDLRTTYRRINELLVAALARLGVRAEIAQPTTRALPPGLTPCFDAPSAGELIVDGRKLVGSAQWRSADALLQHGSILVRDDQHLLLSLMNDAATPPPPAATLADILGREPSIAEMTDAFAESLSATGHRPERIDGPALSDPRLVALTDRYSSDSWTWRR
jgi:lipoate-protein ligase A